MIIYNDKKRIDTIHNMSIKTAVDDINRQKDLKRLYALRIHNMFYEKGIRSEFSSYEETVNAFEELIQNYVAEGLDRKNIENAIKRGFEFKQKELERSLNSKGKSR